MLQRTGLAEFMLEEDTMPVDVQIVRAAARAWLDLHTDPGTRLALLREWGGEEVEWCLNHDRQAIDGECGVYLDGAVNVCRVVDQIRVPLDALDPDPGKTQ